MRASPLALLLACSCALSPMTAMAARNADSLLLPSVPDEADPLEGIGVAAVVNDEAITKLEMRDRIGLILSTTSLPDTQETKMRLVPQVIRMLIDEHLQMQEAKRLNITVPDGAVKEAVKGIEEQAGRPAGSLEADVKSKGASIQSLYAQLRAQAAWSQIITQKIRPRIRVSNEEATREAARISNAGTTPAGAQELNLTVMTLPVENAATDARVKALAEQVSGQVKKGANLGTLSRQLASRGAPAPAEGVWVALADLDPALATPLKTAKKGEVVGPVRTRAGYQLVQMNGTRASAAAEDAAPVEILLKQILFALPAEAKKTEVDATLSSAREVQKNPGTCADNSVAGLDDPKEAHVEVSYLRTLLQRLPEPVQPLVRALSVGTVSEPFATPDGIEVLVMCERIEQPKETADPNEEVKNRIFREKIEREAMKYLRDLRRGALIDVRIK